MKYTNDRNLPLSLSVWLATDNYTGGSPDPKTISATTLLKPIKEIVLSTMHPVKVKPDIADLRAARTGTAVHSSISQAWTNSMSRMEALLSLGYPAKTAQNLRVNPDVHDEAYYNVYVEQRTTRKLAGWTITGEFDFHSEETFQDFKNTSVYSYTSGVNDKKYIAQMSIYRWLFPNLPSNGTGMIHFLFSDWKASNSYQDNYPTSDIANKTYRLWDTNHTERWISNRLQLIDQAINGYPDQTTMPTCGNEETWTSASTFKYYSKVGAVKATKVCGSAMEAFTMLQDKGCGEVREFKGNPMYCSNYCSAREICEQVKGVTTDVTV